MLRIKPRRAAAVTRTFAIPACVDASVTVPEIVPVVPANTCCGTTALPSAFDAVNATTPILAPATPGTYYLHFHINYSGGTGTSIDWNSAAINVTNVSYTPAISFGSPATFDQGRQVYTASPNVSIPMSDTGDTGKPSVATTLKA